MNLSKNIKDSISKILVDGRLNVLLFLVHSHEGMQQKIAILTCLSNLKVKEKAFLIWLL